MAALLRPEVANYMTTETHTADTKDHEDHTFCGSKLDSVTPLAATGHSPARR